ncbi:GDSL esterase/lipase [Cucumis melo var. makuwa]|uniref:GDSL esterase/lipase n=2 Tax=Cucumis melo TaxID=3656 RepID=A0A5D3D053_CUCMM|nr:GDSL esterase/lipase At5g03980-like [Cucumis melo]TYK17000.1 GDSL esterase/lipase [Cucumis melo var. makuwa]
MVVGMISSTVSNFFSSSLLLLLLLLVVFPFGSNSEDLKACKLDSIFQFGDSLADTGNLIRENPSTPFAHLPYGQTFFNKPTGRCSNGLLMVDYFALAAGLPLVNPYLQKKASFVHGVNFAVAGSTALPLDVLAQNNVTSPVTNTSLTKQLDWMHSYLRTICSNKRDDCTMKLKHALFFMGEIGGNDYNYALFEGKTVSEVKNMVPRVVQTIMGATKRVIDYGATRVIIPGHFSMGCLPIYLTGFQTNDSTAYDKFHCLKDFNGLASYHNNKLKQAIKLLRKENPNVIIAYGDYYNALFWVFQHASLLGFDETRLQKSCCGTGGDYNFNVMQICGLPRVPVCSNPDKHISWDGIHLTQKTYQIMAHRLIRDILPKFRCGSN